MSRSTPMEQKEMDILTEYLKTRDQLVKLNEIVTATEGLIKWPKQNAASAMSLAMEQDKRIQRVGRGYYKFVPIEPEHKVSAAVERATRPIPEKPPLPSAVYAAPNVFVIPKDNGGAAVLHKDEIVHGQVTGVYDYGVFIELPEHGRSGLLHKSKIKDGKSFFSKSDIERHFRYGDWVNAKVESFRANGKIALSTVGLELPDYSKDTQWAEQLGRIIADQNPPASEGVPHEPQEPVSAPVTLTQAITPTKMEEQPTMTRTSAISPVSSMKDELDELYEIVRKKVGVISLNSKDALREIVRQNGLVKVTMLLVTTNDFEADVSLAFIRHLEQKVNGGL